MLVTIKIYSAKRYSNDAYCKFNCSLFMYIHDYILYKKFIRLYQCIH